MSPEAQALWLDPGNESGHGLVYPLEKSLAELLEACVMASVPNAIVG